MNPKMMLRAIVAGTLGLLFGLNVHRGYEKWSRLGIDSFLQSETARFNRFMLIPQPELHTLSTFIIAALLVAALYEFIVAGVSRLLKIPT